MSDNRVLTLKEDLIEIADAIRVKKKLKGDLTFSQLKANALEAINTSEFNEYYTKDISTWDTLNVNNFEKVPAFPKTLLIHSNGVDVYYEDNGLYHYNTVTKANTFLCSFSEGFYFYTSMESSNGTVYIQYCYSSSNSTFYKILGTTLIKTYEGVSLGEGTFYETKKGDVYAYKSTYYGKPYYSYLKKVIHLGDVATELGWSFRDFIETSEGNLYIAEYQSTGGLYYIQGATITKIYESGTWLYNYETRNGDLYISGNNGLLHITEGTATLLTTSKGINTFFETSKGDMYVCCSGSGGLVGFLHINGTTLEDVHQDSPEGARMSSYAWYFYEVNNNQVYATNFNVEGIWYLTGNIATKAFANTYTSATFYACKDGYSYMTLSGNYPGIYTLEGATVTKIHTSGYWDTEVLNTEEGLFLLLSGTLLKVSQGETTELQTSLGSTKEIFKLDNKTLFTTYADSKKHLYYLANSQLKTVVSAKWDISDDRNGNWSINLFESSDGTLYISSTLFNSTYGWSGIYTIQPNLTITKVYDRGVAYNFFETLNSFIYASPTKLPGANVSSSDRGIVKLSTTTGEQIYAEGLEWIPRVEKDTKILFSTLHYPDTKDDIAVIVEEDTVHRLLLTKSIATEGGEDNPNQGLPTWETFSLETEPLLQLGNIYHAKNGIDCYGWNSNSSNENGVYYLNKKTKEIKKIFNDGHWGTIFETSKGDIYLGTYTSSTCQGLLHLKSEIATHIYTKAKCLDCFFESSKGHVYVSSSYHSGTGLIHLDGVTAKQIYTKGYMCEKFFEDSKQNLYTVGAYTGFLLLDGETITVLSEENKYSTYNSYFEDSTGRVFAGSTNSNGYGVIIIKDGVLTQINEGFPFCKFFETSQGIVYACGPSKTSKSGYCGILKVDGDTITVLGEDIQYLYGMDYWCEDNNGNVYCSGYPMIAYITNDTCTLLDVSKTTYYEFAKDKNGDIYCGSSNKLYLLQNGVATNVNPTSSEIRRFITDKEDRLYAYGYYTLLLENSTATQISDGYRMLTALKCSDGTAYLSSSQYSYGILLLDGTNSRKIYKTGVWSFLLEINGNVIASDVKNPQSGGNALLLKGDSVEKIVL